MAKNKFSSGAILFRKENEQIYYLLLKHTLKEEYWAFPKGEIEKKESEVEAAKRETEEETGISKITIIPKFKEYLEWFYRMNNELIHKRTVFFLAETNQKEIKISKEHEEAQWLIYEEAMQKLTHKNHKELLKKANEFVISLQKNNLTRFLK